MRMRIMPYIVVAGARVKKEATPESAGARVAAREGPSWGSLTPCLFLPQHTRLVMSDSLQSERGRTADEQQQQQQQQQPPTRLERQRSCSSEHSLEGQRSLAQANGQLIVVANRCVHTTTAKRAR